MRKNPLDRQLVMMFAIILATKLGWECWADAPPAGMRNHPTIEYVKKLSHEEARKYVRRLGSTRKLDDLLLLLDSDLSVSGFAAIIYVESLESDKAVAFCATLDLGKPKWSFAVYGLGVHPKKKVIGYFKQIATSQIREVRAICYSICGSQGWDDLVSIARKDLADDRPLFLPSQRLGQTLGTDAKRYIDRVTR